MTAKPIAITATQTARVLANRLGSSNGVRGANSRRLPAELGYARRIRARAKRIVAAVISERTKSTIPHCEREGTGGVTAEASAIRGLIEPEVPPSGVRGGVSV